MQFPWWKGFFIRSLQIDILSAFLFLILVCSITIISYTYKKNSEMILNFSQDYMEKVSELAVNKVMHLLTEAQKEAEIGAQIINFAKDVTIKNEDLTDFMFAVLKYNPYFDSYLVGLKDGSLLAVSRLSENQDELMKLPEKPPEKSFYRIRFIDQTVDPATDTWIYYDRKGKKLEEKVLLNPQFDPRTRPWYVNKKDIKSGMQDPQYQGIKGFLFFKKQNHWSEIYIFDLLHRSGITVTGPIYSPQGEYLGMFGMDISLDEISEFLKEETIGKSGTEVIISDSGEVIAGPNLKNEKKRLGLHTAPTVYNITNQVYKKAFEEFRKTEDTYFIFEADNEKYIASLSFFPVIFDKHWIVLITVPLKDFLGAVLATHAKVLLISIVIVALSAIAVFFMAKRIAKPIVRLAHEIDEIRNFNLQNEIKISSNIKEIKMISEATASMQTAIRSLGYFVPKELVKKLITQGVDMGLGGQSKNLTIFFSDIMDFTAISETMSPEELMLHLSKYLDEIAQMIIQEKGTIDKYIGDNVMAFWGAPQEDREKSLHSSRAALLSLSHTQKLNEKWQKENKPCFKTKIAIHTGDVVVGNIGTFERRNYTIVGDNVNLTSRLVSLNKFYGTYIIISEDLYNEIKDKFLTRPLDIVAVKGKKVRTKIYELLAQYNAEPEIAPTQEMIDFCAEFTKAYDLFVQRKFQEAEQIFKALLEKKPEDTPCKIYIDRCVKFIKNPPPDDWDATNKMEIK